MILSLAGCQRYEPAPELGEKSMVGRQEEHDPGGGSGPEKRRDPEDGNGWEETDGLSAQNGWPGDNGQENDGQPGNADREIGIEAGNSESALAKAELSFVQNRSGHRLRLREFMFRPMLRGWRI